MDKQKLDELDRRNSMNNELVLEKLNNIDKKVDNINITVRENYRALRGSNGDAGMVADMEIVKDKIEKIENNHIVKAGCTKKFDEIGEVLHGKGKDDSGVVGEQLQIRKFQKWTIGVGTAVLIAIIIQIITGIV